MGIKAQLVKPRIATTKDSNFSKSLHNILNEQFNPDRPNKREWLDRFHIIDYDHAHRLVFEYIEAFYNTVRIHSHCNYMSLDQFEKLYMKVAA
ncbi:MAG: hypothetical protein J6M24_05450 [Lachnospiraceae bacterium]|nr:hypothetical protein [Lachnospiraceae bacterium]